MLNGRIYLGPFEVPIYFSMISLVYCVGLYWFYIRTRNRGLNVTYALDLGFIIMFAGFLGARLFHVFYEYPDLYTQKPLKILYFWNGGFVFFGGALTATMACLLFARFRKLPVPVWSDLITPVLIFGYGMGRVAGFLSGSSYGRPTTLPWGVSYEPGLEAPPYEPLHPAALYEATWSFATLALLLILERRRAGIVKANGAIFDLALICHGLGRMGMEYFRGDYRGPVIMGLSVSTWIAAVITSWGILSLVQKIKPESTTSP